MGDLTTPQRRCREQQPPAAAAEKGKRGLNLGGRGPAWGFGPELGVFGGGRGRRGLNPEPQRPCAVTPVLGTNDCGLGQKQFRFGAKTIKVWGKKSQDLGQKQSRPKANGQDLGRKWGKNGQGSGQ